MTGGKGSSIKGSLIDSGEGDLAKRSAFAIGMIDTRFRYCWSCKKPSICRTSGFHDCLWPAILALSISRYDSAKPARVYLHDLDLGNAQRVHSTVLKYSFSLLLLFL